MKDPAFLFYPNDWLGGTMGMTFEEKGAYMDLLMMQFNRGHMTSHMIGQTVGQLWVNIQDKFTKDDKGLYYNERLEEEQRKRKAYSDSRRNNKTGKNQHSLKEKKVGHMTSHMEDEDVNENKDINKGEIKFHYTSETFKEAWNIWKDYKKDQHRFVYKSHTSEQAAIDKLSEIASTELLAIKTINESIAQGWKGFFKLNENGKRTKTNTKTFSSFDPSSFPSHKVANSSDR